MNRKIRLACPADMEQILVVMADARETMRRDGNLHQWEGGYPSEDVIFADIDRGAGFVIEEEGEIVAYFAFLPSPEPTYEKIYGGEWVDDAQPYYVVHRIASLARVHGIFERMMRFWFSHSQNIRIDTHRDNGIMRHNLMRHGFTYCGIIYLESGDERLAFQKVINTQG